MDEEDKIMIAEVKARRTVSEPTHIEKYDSIPEPLMIETKEEYEVVAKLVYNPPKANKKLLNLIREYRESKKG